MSGSVDEQSSVKLNPMVIAIAAVEQLRPKHWVKNAFMFPAIVFSGRFTNVESWLLLGVGFMSLSLLASSGYVLNDFLDREADRNHPKKCRRPIASGRLSVPVALMLFLSVLASGLALAWSLSPPFFVVAASYLLTTLSYSFYFKHRVILDVMFLASGFVWRVIAGAVAINVHVSPWLFLTAAFLALFLGFNKRRGELKKVGAGGGTRKNLALYSEQLLIQLQSIVTGSLVLCYSLSTVNSTAPWTIVTVPFVLYGIFRYIYLVERKGEGDAPDETVLRDWPIMVTVLLYGVVAMAIVYATQQGWLPPVSAME